MSWYHIVTQDISQLPHAISHFEAEYDAAKNDCRITGNIEKAAAQMPGIVEHRFQQLQEIEAILEYLNIEHRRIRSKHFRSYLETYARALSSRDVEKYVDGEPEVVTYDLLINEFALIRNKWLGISKSLDQKQWQITNIVKLRCAGLDDATL